MTHDFSLHFKEGKNKFTHLIGFLLCTFLFTTNNVFAIENIGIFPEGDIIEQIGEYGIRVAMVYPNGPADKAGIKIGDAITHLNGKRVKNLNDYNDIGYKNVNSLDGFFSDGSNKKIVNKLDIHVDAFLDYYLKAFRHSSACNYIEVDQYQVIDNSHRGMTYCYNVYISRNEDAILNTTNHSGDANIDLIVYKYPQSYQNDGEIIVDTSQNSGTSSDEIEFGHRTSRFGWYQIIAYHYDGEENRDREGKFVLTYNKIRGYSPNTSSVPYRTESAQSSSICRDISSFCAEFILKSTACGFVGGVALNEASKETAGKETGTAGNAASSAACTVILSQMEEIDLEPGDVVASVISGVAGDSALDDLGEGNVWSSLFKGLVALGATGYSYDSCMQTVRARCR